MPNRSNPIKVYALGVPSYTVSQEQAEIMVARGSALWLAGLRAIQECKRTERSAANRQWRKTPCYDPDTRVVIHTMQLVVPHTDYHQATINSKGNGKRKYRRKVLAWTA